MGWLGGATTGAALGRAAIGVAGQVALAKLTAPKIGRIKPTATSVINKDAAEAADRERRRREAAAGHKTILTGPLGAVENPLVRRSVLSGG